MYVLQDDTQFNDFIMRTNETVGTRLKWVGIIM